MSKESKNVGKKAEFEMGRSRGRLVGGSRIEKSCKKSNLGEKAEVELTEVVGSLRVR